MPQEMTALLISSASCLIDLHLMRRDSKSYINSLISLLRCCLQAFIIVLFMMLTIENKIFTGLYTDVPALSTSTVTSERLKTVTK